jgi:hypothetical protein
MPSQNRPGGDSAAGLPNPVSSGSFSANAALVKVILGCSALHQQFVFDSTCC